VGWCCVSCGCGVVGFEEVVLNEWEFGWLFCTCCFGWWLCFHKAFILSVHVVMDVKEIPKVLAWSLAKSR
jgi:hypothetical protein